MRVSENNNCDEIDELAVSFNNMATSLQQQEELSRGFVANVSHELKTPMTSIRGFVDGMLDGTIPPEKHTQYLKIISEEVGRLSRLVIRMLDAAKIQAGELIITPAPFDLIEMVARVLISFENQINDKHLDMDVEMADSLIVYGDGDHIYRVIYNLVDNAVKFVNDGGKLTIRAEQEGTMSRFLIRNTGSEIPAEDLPHVFERFYKVDRSRSRDKTGRRSGIVSGKIHRQHARRRYFCSFVRRRNGIYVYDADGREKAHGRNQRTREQKNRSVSKSTISGEPEIVPFCMLCRSHTKNTKRPVKTGIFLQNRRKCADSQKINIANKESPYYRRTMKHIKEMNEYILTRKGGYTYGRVPQEYRAGRIGTDDTVPDTGARRRRAAGRRLSEYRCVLYTYK